MSSAVTGLPAATHVLTAKWRGAMNNLHSFLAFTAAIFGAITALLMLLSHLEPTSRTQKRWVFSADKKAPRGDRSSDPVRPTSHASAMN